MTALDDLEWLIDARAEWPPVTDQGQRGTCLSMAMTSAHERGHTSALSAEYLHWSSASYPGGRGIPSAALRAIETAGQPPHEQWPYDPKRDDSDGSYQPPASVTGPFSATDRHHGSVTLDQVIDQLKEGAWPVVIIRVTDAFAAAGQGVVLPDGEGNARHAVLAVGVARVTTDRFPNLSMGERLVCLRNSWGTDWGSGGMKLMSEQALNECFLGSFALS